MSSPNFVKLFKLLHQTQETFFVFRNLGFFPRFSASENSPATGVSYNNRWTKRMVSARLRRSGDFLELTRILSGIHFTRHFIVLVVVETKWFVSSKRDFDAANLRPALEHVCGKQTLSAGILVLRASLSCVPNIKMQRRVGSSSVHDLGICKENAIAHWQILTKFAAKHVF